MGCIINTQANQYRTTHVINIKTVLAICFKCYVFQIVIRHYRSFSKAAFVKALQKLIPEIESQDLLPGGAGVRAQACDFSGGLVDDFYFVEEKNILHVCNAPSPAATSSLAIGETIAEKI